MRRRGDAGAGLVAALVVVLLAATARQTSAQPGAPSGLASAPVRPAYRPLRYDERWDALRDPARRTDRWDRLKFLPLDRDGATYLTLGGETRLRVEGFVHPGFGAEPADGRGRTGYALRRSLAHADLHVGPRVRAFVQLQSAAEAGRVGGPRPTDADALDVHQAFVDVVLGAGRGTALDAAPTLASAGTSTTLTVRTGRQELEFGSARLVSTREGLNTRLAFDAVRLIGRRGAWEASAQAMRPVLAGDGAFDSRADAGQALWGGYLARTTPHAPNAILYYTALARRAARFDQGTARERRHTAGARVWGTLGAADARARWDADVEAAVQTGRFGAGRIRAWDVATDYGVTLAAPLRPRLGLRADMTSGDRDPTDRTLGTFNGLFPGTAYSGLAGLVGPANVVGLAPSVALRPARAVAVTAGVANYWRAQRRDGVYGVGGGLVRSGRGPSGARAVGTQGTVRADWGVTRHLSVSATAAYFAAGRFLREAPPGRDVQYLTGWTTYRF